MSERSHFWLAFALYWVLSLIKIRAFAGVGRFWAEEGKYFYADIARAGFGPGLRYLFNGHLELLSNFSVALATLVELRHAPLVTTYISLALQSAPVALLLARHAQLGLGRAAALAVVVMLVGLPQAGEVWANSINLHFHAALLVALIAVLDVPIGRAAWLSRSLLLFGGLSGIPANFLAPVFLYRAMVERSRERWLQFALLAACAALQIGLLLMNGIGAAREIGFDPLLYARVLVAQHEYGLVFGTKLGARLASKLLGDDARAYGLLLVSALPFALLLWRLLREPRARILVACALLLSIMCFATALGEKLEFVSPIDAGRYFYAPNVLLVVALFGLLRAERRSWWVYGLCLLLVCVALPRTKSYLKGPDWRIEYQRAIDEKAATIAIWPNGWTMQTPQVQPAR